MEKIIGKKDKYCPDCKQTLPADKFYEDWTTKSGLSTYCRGCEKRQQKEHYKKSQKEALKRVLEYERQTSYADHESYGKPGYVFGSDGMNEGKK